MIKNNIKKLITCLVTIAMISVTAAFLCFGKTDTVSDYEFVSNYFTMDDESREFMKAISEALYGSAETIRHDDIFLGDSCYVPIENSKGELKIAEEIYDRKLNLDNSDAYIVACRYDDNEDNTVKIVIRYRNNNSGSGVFLVDSNGETESWDNFTSKKEIIRDDGCTVLTICMSAEELEKASYYKNRDDNIYVLKLDNGSANTLIDSISIETGKGCSVQTVITDDNERSCNSIAVVPCNVTDNNDGSLQFTKNGDDIKFDSSENIQFNTSAGDIICDVTGDVVVGDILEVNEEYVAAEVLGNNESNAESVTDEDILNTDIEEREYLSLDDVCSSAVYSDGYVFTGTTDKVFYGTKTGTSGQDSYINIYTDSSSAGQGEILGLNEEDLLGSSYEDLMMFGNILAMKVSNVCDSECAGTLAIKLDSFLEHSFEEEYSEATPSECADNEEDEENNEDINIITDAMYLSSFGKNGDTVYDANLENIQLTDAFLKKASYCAVDSNGIVCAIYNEHGRLVSLADGYSEEDIDAYILIPQLSEEDKASDTGIADITVKYNDLLSAEGNYVSVVYSDEYGKIVESDVNASVFLDSDTEMNLMVDIDSEHQVISITGNITDADFIIDTNDDYTVTYSGKNDLNVSDEVKTAEEEKESTESGVEDTISENGSEGNAEDTAENDSEEMTEDGSAEETLSDGVNSDSEDSNQENSGSEVISDVNESDPENISDEGIKETNELNQIKEVQVPNEDDSNTIANDTGTGTSESPPGIVDESPPGITEGSPPGDSEVSENSSSNITETTSEMTEGSPPAETYVPPDPPPPQEIITN